MRHCTPGTMGSCLNDIPVIHRYKMRHDSIRQTGYRSASKTLILAGERIIYPSQYQLGNLDDFDTSAAIPPHNNRCIDRMGKPALPLPLISPPSPPRENERVKESEPILPTSTRISITNSGNENRAAICFAGTASTGNGFNQRPSTRPPPPPATATANQEQQQQRQNLQQQPHHHHPLGAMFVPEQDKSGVIRLVSEVLCKPGYTAGPQDERRLLRQIRNGRVDLRTMSRMLLWLQRDGAKKELCQRGLKFIGPSANVQPYTTGIGMSWLLQEVCELTGLSCRQKTYSEERNTGYIRRALYKI